MRNIEPRMAGAASGVLNTVRQVGLVIGTAAVGALLQNRLVSAMADQASTRSAALPQQVRGRFVAGIDNSAKNGIQVGAGQSGGSTHLGPGVSARVAAEAARIGHDVFTFTYVTAMRQTMLLPIILLGVGALSCLAIKRGKRAPEPAEAAKTETPHPLDSSASGCAWTEVFTQGYVPAMRWTMVLPIAVVALAAVSCLAIRNKAGGQDRIAAPGADSGQMAGTISSPGSSGHSPGSSSGIAS